MRSLVTGASQGLGREIARHLAESGADLALCARTGPDLDLAAGQLAAAFPSRKILAFRCDIGRSDEVDDLYSRVVQELGGLDVVINNAGVHGPIGAVDEIDWAAWEGAIATNLLGTVYSCRMAVRYFKSRHDRSRRAKIINLSGGGATAPQPGLTAYGASKAAIVRFTETLAEEVRPHGIDVNAVAPGALATRLTRELRDAGASRIGSEYHGRVVETLERGGAPMERAAKLCLYLASSASDGVTGKLISAMWDPWPFADEIKKDLAQSDVYTLRRITGRDRGFAWGDR